ncbi:MAG: hypothetical protein WCY19_03190 [Candidatus Gastranaerophilaceae bacterium]
MPGEIHHLEESLKEFLADAQNDSYNARNTDFHKYNNLKIYMEPNQNKNPHFVVRIGISEAMYSLNSGEKILGGLGSDERLIRRWFDKAFIRSDLNIAWNKSKKVKAVSVKEDDDFD